MELTKSITSPGAISLLSEYHIPAPYLPPDVNFDHITVTMLDTNNYADAMDRIVQLQTYNIDFNSEGFQLTAFILLFKNKKYNKYHKQIQIKNF